MLVIIIVLVLTLALVIAVVVFIDFAADGGVASNVVVVAIAHGSVCLYANADIGYDFYNFSLLGSGIFTVQIHFN